MRSSFPLEEIRAEATPATPAAPASSRVPIPARFAYRPWFAEPPFTIFMMVLGGVYFGAALIARFPPPAGVGVALEAGGPPVAFLDALDTGCMAIDDSNDALPGRVAIIVDGKDRGDAIPGETCGAAVERIRRADFSMCLDGLERCIAIGQECHEALTSTTTALEHATNLYKLQVAELAGVENCEAR